MIKVMAIMNYLLTFILVLLFPNPLFGDNSFGQYEAELTFSIEPGTQECFYQAAKQDDEIDIEFQVLDIGSGPNLNQEMDINFFAYSPSGSTLFADHRKTDMVHRIYSKETGDYKFCFDNTFSRFSPKTVYFEIYVDDKKSSNGWEENFPDLPTEESDPKDDDYKKIMDYLVNIHEDLNKARHFQDSKRATEARHRNIQEHNYNRVNQFSILAIVVVIVVGIVQIVMVRSLFDNQSKLHRIFKYLS